MEPMVIAEAAAVYGIKAPPPLLPSERYMSPNEAGRILNVTGEAVKQWIYRRRLPATKLSNGYWKVRVQDLDDFIKARHNFSSKRILLLHRAGAELDEMVKAIAGMGHEAVVANNTADALLKATDLFPSLFIVDVATPEFEPWKLLTRIRSTRNIKNAPILLVSDQDLKDAEGEHALELGIQGLMKRPLTSQMVVQEIAKVLGRVL